MTDTNRVDPVQIAARAKERRKSLRELPRLLWVTLRLLRTAAGATLTRTVLLQAFIAASLVAQVLLIKEILDVVLAADGEGGSIRPAVVPVVALAALTAATTIASTVGSLQQRVLSDLVSREVWRRILDVTESVDLARFEDPDFHDQTQRVKLSAAVRTLATAEALMGLVGGGLGAVAGALAVLALAPQLLPLLLAASVPLLWMSRKAGRLEFDFAVAQTPRGRERVYLQGLLTSRDEAKEVRAFSLAGALRRRWESVYGAYIDDLRGLQRRRTWLALGGSGMAAVLTGAALVVMLVLVDRGDLGVAQAGAALVAVRLMAGRLGQLIGGVSALYESALFLEDLGDFLARRAERISPVAGQPPSAAFDSVSVDDVSFGYPHSAERVLHGIKMTLRRGEVVALVGENGSGKTTLAKILAGLYRPDSGRVLWDGVDSQELDEESLRSRVAVIFQDFVRYKLSARDNIALGRPDAVDDATVRRAAAAAGADGFIERLPAGYDTMLSKEFLHGVDLSLGQWQRVALARAFVRDSPLVVLDEPSASLDARAEADLFDRIRGLLAGRTVLLISHRFSSVRSADRIYVLQEGRIVEQGSHDELTSAGGLYAELFELQARAYRPDMSGGALSDR